MQHFSPEHERFRDAGPTVQLMEPNTDSAFSKQLTLAAMSLGYGVVQLDVTIVNTALNSIGTSLGGGVSELQWVVSTYTIAFAALILTAGALGDRLGAKSNRHGENSYKTDLLLLPLWLARSGFFQVCERDTPSYFRFGFRA
jgi:MFS family permease